MASPTGENLIVDVALRYQDAANANQVIKDITLQLEKQGIALSKNAKILGTTLTTIKGIDNLSAKLQVGNKQVDISGLQGQVGSFKGGQFLPGGAGRAPAGGQTGFFVDPNIAQDTLKVTAHGKAQETLGTQVANAAKRAAFTIPIWTALRFVIGGLITNLISAGQAFVGFAIDIDKTIAKLRAVSDESENSKDNIEKISTSLKNLSLSSGKSVSELGDALFDLKRAGLSSEDALSALDAVTNLSVGSFVNQKDATLALVDSLNLLGPEIEKAADGVNKYNFVAGIFTALGNKSSATTEELVETFRKFVSAGTAVGLTFKQIITLTAAMNQLGVRGTEAGTALSRVFLLMQQNSPVVKQLLKRDVTDPFNDFFDILKRIQDIKPNQRGSVLEAIFGIRGLKGPAALSQNIDQLKEFQKLTEDLINNPKGTSEIAGNQANVVRQNIGDLFKTLGSGLLQTLDATLKFSSTLQSAAKNTKEIADNFAKIRDFLQKTPLTDKGIIKAVVGGTASAIGNKVFGGPSANDTQDAIREQQVAREAREKNDAFRKQAEDATQKEINAKRQLGSFITPAIQEEIDAYRREKEAIEDSSSSVDKKQKAQIRANNAVQEFVKKFNDLKKIQTTAEDVNKAFDSGKIEEFFNKIQLNASTPSAENDLFKKAGEARNKLKEIEQQDAEELRRIRLEGTLEEIDFLRTVGATESDINAKRLEAIKAANVGWRELEEERKKQHAAELARISEISNALKGSFETNLGDLFKNKISVSKFGTNFGDSIQNSIIDSTSKGLGNAFAGTGFFEQLGISGTGIEDAFSKTGNMIIDSFTAGARAAAPILSQAIASGANGGSSGGSGGAGGVGGAVGGLGALFSGKPLAKPIGANGQAISQGQGLFNAGLAGVFGAISGAQRGTGQAIAGGIGGALTSFAPFMGALGPIGLIAGAGLTIASMFGGKKKITEQTQEQTVQIASRIDVTNKKLDVVNRNLVALRAIFETYPLPDSAYFSESRNIADQFSLHQRRGLVI